MLNDSRKLAGFKSHLAQKNLKLTRERECIYDRVMHLKGHFDTESLYELLTKEKSGIARGTVFRTIPLLLESGVIQTSVGKGKGEFFESTSSKNHHDHIICVSCGKVIEYFCEEIEKLQSKICEKYNVELLFHDHKLYVRCAKCRK
jgi:Fur family ferric uptake transcriptional regulator